MTQVNSQPKEMNQARLYTSLEEVGHHEHTGTYLQKTQIKEKVIQVREGERKKIITTLTLA